MNTDKKLNAETQRSQRAAFLHEPDGCRLVHAAATPLGLFSFPIFPRVARASQPPGFVPESLWDSSAPVIPKIQPLKISTAD